MKSTEIWNVPAKIVVTCARGLTSLLAAELQSLNFPVVEISDTSVSTRGTLADTMRLNLWLRTAHRVLWPLLQRRVHTLDELYRAVNNIPWEYWLSVEDNLTVSASVVNTVARDTRMPSLKTKDAIVDRLRRLYGRRPDSGSDFSGAAVFIFWHETDLRVYLDTTGIPLSRRGYRRQPWQAPMQETLAAACIMSIGWNAKGPLVVPMCGSGTPAIEAALMALRRAPGISRPHFAFMSLKYFDLMRSSWRHLKSEAIAGERTDIGKAAIIASDIAPQAISAARANARLAGVENIIRFETCDFGATTIPPAPGMLFMNPEYGERLGNAAELVPVYERIGKFLRERCAGYRAFIFAGNKQLSLKLGLKSSSCITFMNGPITCRLLEFEIFGPEQRSRLQ